MAFGLCPLWPIRILNHAGGLESGQCSTAVARHKQGLLCGVRAIILQFCRDADDLRRPTPGRLERKLRHLRAGQPAGVVAVLRQAVAP